MNGIRVGLLGWYDRFGHVSNSYWMEMKSFGNFSDEVSREPSQKITQNGKNGSVKPKKGLILAIFAILSRFPGRFPWKLVRKISERLPFHQLSLKHIQNYHLSQTNRLGYHTVNLKQVCHNQFDRFLPQNRRTYEVTP